MEDEILLIDKPAGWTSFDVVAKIRGKLRASYKEQGITPTKRQLRVGHAGTLDPFATGLLIILLGDATKKATEFLKLDKVYEAEFVLGQVSTTGDPEGEITAFGTARSESTASERTLQAAEAGLWRSADGDKSPVTVSAAAPSDPAHPTRERIQEVLSQFTGEITQTPPIFSAIKINGQRAYKLAREGKDVAIPERHVTIQSIELLDYSYPSLRLRTHVSSGTYIRSLAVDIGIALGTGAYCQQLRRTRIAEWSVDEAKQVNDLIIATEL